jgi:hypothetical protein
MFTNLFKCAALVALTQATTEIAQSCIEERTHLYGVHAENDLPFTDFNYLESTEEFDTIYRMTRFQLCEDANGDLVGMRAHITRFEAETLSPKTRLSMNKVGTVQGDGISCGSIVLDAENGEYLSGIYFAYSGAGTVDYIRATSNRGQQISKGALTSEMTTSEMTSIQDSRILAFHGYENERIAAVGQVSVNINCIMGVTINESVDEPFLIDIENVGGTSLTSDTKQEEVIPDEHKWAFILVGVVLGVGIMLVAAIVFVQYK